MGKETGHIVGIDVGTSKIATVVGKIKEDGSMEITGVGRTDARGMRRGIVVNLEQASEALRASVEEAELMSGHSVDRALVAVGGCHVRGFNSRGVVAVSNRERIIAKEDIQRVIDGSKTISFPKDQQIFHTIPQEYLVDDQEGISEPLDMTGTRLEANVHIITGSITSLQNLGTVVNRCGVEMTSPVLGLLADAYAVLPSDERELGVALIDVGHGTTGIAVFEKGAIWHTKVIPIGGELFTNDLAVGLKTGIQDAEILKKKYGCALTSLIEEEDVVEVPSIAGKKSGMVPRSRIAEILQPRAEELFQLLFEEVRGVGLDKTINAGVVLTGGGAALEGMVEVAEAVFDQQVRVGEPMGVQGLTSIVTSPTYATAVGLVLYGAQHAEKIGAEKNALKRLWEKMKEMI